MYLFNRKGMLSILLVLLLGIRLFFQSLSIFGGDAGDLVTAAYIHGIPHAPGFPFYTFLGSLLIRIPLYTPAWRITLLSSVPSVLTAFLFFLVLHKLTKSYGYSLIGMAIYSFLYPVFLFSEIPEVVSFNVLFYTILLYILLRIKETKTKRRYIALFFCVLGFAVFHSYIILLIIPSAIYFLRDKKIMTIIQKNYMLFLGLFSIGITPYIYAIIASLSFPALDTEHPANIGGLLRLIMRSSYGTFKLSHNIYFNIGDAINSVINFLNLVSVDYKLFGVIFILIGMVYTFMKQRNTFFLLFINLLIIVIFFAYASFPMTLPLHWGIFEKYLPYPYLFLTLFMILGVLGLIKKLQAHIDHVILKKIVILSVSIAFFAYTGILFINNYRRILVLKYDITAEHLSEDLLASIPENGIVNFTDDTSYFNTLYVHYVLNRRPDVIMVDFNLLRNSYYRTVLQKKYPHIYLPRNDMSQKEVLQDFLDKNAKQHVILNSQPDQYVQETWLPHGLVWMYYPPDASLPKPQQLIYENLVLWKEYHGPYSGSLGKYQTLLLSDVLRIYAIGHQSFGLMLYKNKEYNLAANEFRDAVNYLPEVADNYINLARTYIDWGKCADAEKTLNTAVNTYRTNKELYKLYIALYGICYKNNSKLKFYVDMYNKLNAQ